MLCFCGGDETPLMQADLPMFLTEFLSIDILRYTVTFHFEFTHITSWTPELAGFVCTHSVRDDCGMKVPIETYESLQALTDFHFL